MNMKRKSVVTFVSLLCVVAALCGMAFVFWGHAPGKVSKALEAPEEVRLPFEPTLIQLERWKLLEKVHDPFRLVATGMFVYTFGQGAKFCDWVVVGTVEEMKETKFPYLDEFIGHRVVLSVDACLYGKRPGKKMTFMIADTEIGFEPTDSERRVTQPGDRVLAFLTDQWYEIVYFMENPFTSNLALFDFDRTKVTPRKMNALYARSYMILDDKTAEEEAIRVAKGYLEVFGKKGHRDRDKYIEFLCSLLNSPVQRIGDDAESDLVLFYTQEKDPLPDLDKLLADDRVRKEVKDYLRSRLRNEKPNEE